MRTFVATALLLLAPVSHAVNWTGGWPVVAIRPNFQNDRRPVVWLDGGIFDAVKVARGALSTTAIRRNGAVVSWGEEVLGAGFGPNYRATAGPVLGLDRPIVDIHAGVKHFVALAEDGTVWVWGSNEGGALGDGGVTNFAYVAQQVPGLTGVVKIGTSGNSTYAQTSNGSVYRWGWYAN